MASFRAQHEGNADETKRRYKRILRYFTEFCATEALTYVDQINLEAIDRYARSRNNIKSWTKDVELLRQLFEFCRDREWSTRNPAKALKIPKMLEANHVVPYTHDEIVKIIAACDEFGKYSYERRRARAMTLLMRYAGLRISDVVTLAREHIQGQYLVKRAVKNNKVIRVELPSSVLEALEVLPFPKAAAKDNQRYFASDSIGLRSLVKGAWRTIDAVFKRSGVVGRRTAPFSPYSGERTSWSRAVQSKRLLALETVPPTDPPLLREVDTGVPDASGRPNSENPRHTFGTATKGGPATC